MDPIEWTVVIASALAIAALNAYFFLAPRRRSQAREVSGGIQEATIVVRGGYEPAEVRLAAGVRARLIFDRQEDSGCSEEVVIPDFGVRRFLPAFERTAIELEPRTPGEHEFTCGMGMLRGRIVVGEPGAPEH